MQHIKQELYRLCELYIEKRMEAAGLAINEAREAANSDTKSSAGDKYETGREMMQQETNRNMAQLAEAAKLKTALERININNTAPAVGAGSLVITDRGNFFIAVSAGAFIIDNQNYFTVSPFSPIGIKMSGLKIGDKFNLNDKIYHIRGLF